MSGGDRPMDQAVDLATIKAGAAAAAAHPMIPKAVALAVQALARLIESQHRRMINLQEQNNLLRDRVGHLENGGR